MQCDAPMRFLVIAGLASLATLIPDLADAAPRRYYRYDRADDYRYPDHTGLFVRGVLGIGGVTADDELNDSTLSGGAGMFSLDVGGALAPSLALHGRLSQNSMFEPSVSDDGDYLGDLDDTSLTFRLLGLGLTYYLPSNVYLTGVLGLSQASFDFAGEEYDTLNGIGFSGDIGYEWPIGGDFGLGVAGRLELHSVRDDAGTLSTAGLGVLVSLSYF
jgi:hypothetical protein